MTTPATSVTRHGDDEVHALLEPPSVTYTSTSVQRAFVLWTLLGHTHRFRDVCEYYRRLEMLEETFSPEQRKESRDFEYSLLTGQPPTSEWLQEHFPTLYPKHKVQYRYPKEMQKGSGFKVQGSKEVKERDGAIAEQIVEARQLITKYCQTHRITITEFLREFHQYASKSGVNSTVSNVVFYIKYRNVQEERQLEANYHKYDLKFLNCQTDNYDVMDLQTQNVGLKRQQTDEGNKLCHVQVNGETSSNGKACNGQNDYAQMPLSSIYLNGHSSRAQNAPTCKQVKDKNLNGIKQSLKTAQDKERSLFEKVNKKAEEKVKVYQTKAMNTSECGIDDVLLKITDLNLEYGKEINNNDEIRTESNRIIKNNDKNLLLNSEDKTLELENGPLDIFDHEHLMDRNIDEKKNDTKANRLVFAKKNKNQLVPTVVPLKQPSYCMKLKVKSKRSKAKKAKQIKDFATHSDSFKSCELNVSFDLIDLDSTEEQASISNDFVYINDDRCSTLSR